MQDAIRSQPENLKPFKHKYSLCKVGERLQKHPPQFRRGQGPYSNQEPSSPHLYCINSHLLCVFAPSLGHLAMSEDLVNREDYDVLTDT